MEYMSQEGYDELVAELQHMVNVELPAVRDAIAEARDKGDLSENFEYHAAKREQGKLLSRISFVMIFKNIFIVAANQRANLSRLLEERIVSAGRKRERSEHDAALDFIAEAF